jgi:hypothetical protein
MASWTVEGRTTSASNATIGATDRIWWNGPGGFGSNITVGAYNQSMWKSDNANANQVQLMNTRRVASGTVSLNEGGTVNLNTLGVNDAGLRFTFTDSASVTMSTVRAYFYDGTTDATPMAGVDTYLAEIGNSSWTAANGSGAALQLGDKTTAATSHTFYLASSVSPTSTGAKTGALKMSAVYV